MKFRKKDLELQKLLASFGYYSGDLDGLWGRGSKKAYAEYKKATGRNLRKVVKESLGQRRRAFSIDFAKLVLYAESLGLQPQIEDVRAIRQ